MGSILASFHSLARELGRAPGFLLVTVITLGVALGANAALFTVFNAVLIRPLPYPDPDRLVALKHDAPGFGVDYFQLSDGTYALYRKENRVLADLGIYRNGAVTLTGGGAPERLASANVTGSLFSVLESPAELGRTLQEADEKPGAEPVAVLADGLWRRRFGGDPKVVGTILWTDGVARRVVGVMPPGFAFPAPETAIWLPMAIDPAHYQIGDFSDPGIGRLRPGVSPARAARELSALVWRIPEVFGQQALPLDMIKSAKLAVHVTPLRDTIVGDVERVLWIVLGSVVCILLIACANVANLFLVRAEGRQREMAVRTALGAGRGDIVRLFLGESMILSLLAGALGLGLAWAGTRLLVRLHPQRIPRLEEITLDGHVLLFTVLLSVLAGFFCGGLAAWRYGSPALAETLREGGRGGTAGRGRLRARNVLVAAQVALALVLLICSGLMVRSFWRLRGVQPGFDPRGVLTLRLDLPEAGYRDAPAILRFTDQLLERARAVPGVTSAAVVNTLPLGGSDSSTGYVIEGFPPSPDKLPPLLNEAFVSPSYFQTLGIPVLAGRTFESLVAHPETREVMVSRGLAEHFWPGKSPLGKRLAVSGNDKPAWYTIVGVAGDVHVRGLETPPEERVYYPMARISGDSAWAPRDFSLAVKGPGDPGRLVGPVRETIRALDPNLALSEVHPLEELTARSIQGTTYTMLLLAVAAAVALLLGAVGIYGVISYVVSQRTREIGVRMALGAKRDDISLLVLREGLAITLAGVVVGLVCALAVTRLMLALLFGVSPTDPGTFAAVAVLLVAVALLASWLPASRAAAVEPLEAIRYE